MATLEEIKKALKKDPSLLHRLDGLKEFVNDHRDDFQFLFNNERVERRVPSQPEDTLKTAAEPKRWNPKITQI